MNQKELLLLGETKLKQENIQEPKEKARRLLEFILKQSRAQCISNMQEQVESKKQLLYQEKIQELIQGKPLQYITNHQGFMGLDFYVDENVLIPQPDTEILVEAAIKIAKEKMQILDLCTGSGCIGIALAKYLKNAQITLADISKKALEVARKNAIHHQVEDKIELIESNLFENLENKKFDLIISNPPYIRTSVIPTLSKEVRKEPYIALNGGEDGLFFYREILKQGHLYLKSEGYLLLEIGYDQAEEIIKLWKNISSQSLNLVTKQAIQDLGGNDRVLVFQKMVDI